MSQFAKFSRLTSILVGERLLHLAHENIEALQHWPLLPLWITSMPHEVGACLVPATLTFFLFLEISKITPTSRPWHLLDTHSPLLLECASPSIYMPAPSPHSGLSSDATFSKSPACLPSIKQPHFPETRAPESKLDHPSSEGQCGNYFSVLCGQNTSEFPSHLSQI